MREYDDDGELLRVPLAAWTGDPLTAYDIEQLAAKHLNDESGCASGECAGEDGQGWCDAALLLLTLRDTLRALQRYGRHQRGCRRYVTACTCGLAQARARLPE